MQKKCIMKRDATPDSCVYLVLKDLLEMGQACTVQADLEKVWRQYET